MSTLICCYGNNSDRCPVCLEVNLKWSVILDSALRVYSMPPQSMIFENDRFDKAVLSVIHFHLHFMTCAIHG